jgi:hypothetical protein
MSDPPPFDPRLPFTTQPPLFDPAQPFTTKPVSPDPSLTGQAISAFGDVMKGPALTAAVRGLGGLANAAWNPYGTAFAPIRKLFSPEEEARYQAGERPGPGTKLGDAFFRSTGIPEYKPTSAPERMLMAGTEGAVANAPFGWGASLLGLLSGTGGQAVREAGGGERAATAAELLPGVFSSVREARRGPASPTAPELKTAGQAQLRAFGDAPVELSLAPLTNMATVAEPALQRGGFRPRTAPGTFDLLTELRQPDAGGWATGAPGPGGTPSLTMHDLQAIREDLAGTINDSRSPLAAHPKDFAAATATLRQLDDMIENMHRDPANLTAGTSGDALAAINNFQTGRANYLAGQNLNRLTGDLDRARTGVVERAQARTAAANSGANFDNTLRQRVETFMENRNNAAGLSDDALTALDRVVAGGAISNRIRDAANFLGGGKGLGTMFASLSSSIPAALSGRPGLAGALAAAAPVAGITLKGLENRLAQRRLNTALDTIAQDSPLYRERAANFEPDQWAITRPLFTGLLAPPDQRWPY